MKKADFSCTDIIVALGSRGLLPFISDEAYLKAYYQKRTGRTLDFSNLRYFNDKIQWIKLFDRRPEYVSMVDKYCAKEFVSSKIGQEYIIPTLGVWDHFNEIEFNKLPESFVLKCTHDSDSIIIVHDKRNFDRKAAEKKMKKCLKRNYYIPGREWAYKEVKPRIIAEKLLRNDSGEDLKDYKVFNFNGEPMLIQVDFDRFTNHRRNLYTTNWDYINGYICYPTDPEKIIKRPEKLDKMLELARTLSKGYPHIRTDFYVANGQLYFGELTLYHGSGTEKIYPEELELKMGEAIDLNYGKERSCSVQKR